MHTRNMIYPDKIDRAEKFGLPELVPSDKFLCTVRRDKPRKNDCDFELPTYLFMKNEYLCRTACKHQETCTRMDLHPVPLGCTVWCKICGNPQDAAAEGPGEVKV